MSTENINIQFGTSSFSSKDWVGTFYPEGTQPADFLSHYARSFYTVEIDSTYYATPSKSTVRGWYDKTPEGFIFAAKFPRSIVHGGEEALPDPDFILTPDKTYEERDIFLENMGTLGEKLGPFLIQFPYFNKNIFPSPEPFFERLDNFLEDLPAGFRYAVEIRNKYWLNREFKEILRRHNTALTLVDQGWMPMPDEVADPVTSDFTYIRLLGNRKEIEAITRTWEKEVINRDNNIQRIARFLAEIHRQNLKAYAYVNNHYAGHAPATLRKLIKFFNELIMGK